MTGKHPCKTWTGLVFDEQIVRNNKKNFRSPVTLCTSDPVVILVFRWTSFTDLNFKIMQEMIRHTCRNLMFPKKAPCGKND